MLVGCDAPVPGAPHGARAWPPSARPGRSALRMADGGAGAIDAEPDHAGDVLGRLDAGAAHDEDVGVDRGGRARRPARRTSASRSRPSGWWRSAPAARPARCPARAAPRPRPPPGNRRRPSSRGPPRRRDGSRPAMSASVIRRSEWLSIVPTAPAARIASASTAPAPRPGETGSMCWAKTWRCRVSRATAAMSTAWGSKMTVTSSASARRSAARASSTASAP